MTEFNQKLEKLAQFLYELYHDERAWEAASANLRDNYRFDAEMSLLTMPHLLTLHERVRLWREEREYVSNTLHMNGEESLIEEWEEFAATFQREYDDSVRATAAYHSILSALPE